MKITNKMIDIITDELTDCLIRREDNAIVETQYKLLSSKIKKKDYSKWNFDWSIPPPET